MPNKATGEAREAFRRLVEHNAPKMQGWLEEIAKEDPGEALTLMTKLAEFCIPRMARTEVTGDAGVRAVLVIRD